MYHRSEMQWFKRSEACELWEDKVEFGGIRKTDYQWNLEEDGVKVRRWEV